MGLYEKILAERAAEEQRLGGASPRRRGLDSKVLGRRLEGSMDLRYAPPPCLSCTGWWPEALATSGRACGSGA